MGCLESYVSELIRQLAIPKRMHELCYIIEEVLCRAYFCMLNELVYGGSPAKVEKEMFK